MASNSYSKGKYGFAVLGPATQHLTTDDKLNIRVSVRVDPEPIRLVVEPFNPHVHQLRYFPNVEPIQVRVRIPIDE